MKKVVYGVSNVIPAILHHAYYTSPSLLTISPPIYTLPIAPRFRPFPTLYFTTLPITSLHFLTLLDDFHFTSLPFITLNDFPHTLFFFLTIPLSAPSCNFFPLCYGLSDTLCHSIFPYTNMAVCSTDQAKLLCCCTGSGHIQVNVHLLHNCWQF